MKTYGYVRVSTGDQHNSIEVQEKRIRDYCLYKGVYLERIIVDEDVSGGMPFYERPGGSKMKMMIANKVDFKVIAVRPDRMFRNVLDALTVSQEWNKVGVSIDFIDMGGVSLDTNTATGRMVFTQLIMLSEFERNIGKERTKAVMQHKKAKGDVYCREVYGFDKVDGKSVPNEKEQQVIKIVLDMEKSCNCNKIATYLNDNGYRTKSGGLFMCSTVKSIVRNNA